MSTERLEAPVVPATSPRPGARVVSGLGELALTVGVVLLLFVAYEVWFTDLSSDREQAVLTQQLQDRWDAERPRLAADRPPSDTTAIPPLATPVVGQPFASLHIPRLAPDYERAVVEGTGEAQLAGGPGHYVRTALPGERGNFAIAGHRVGEGSPFLDLDRLRPGDPIVVETAHAWYVYRVLGDTTTGDFTDDATGLSGREVVLPNDVAVIAPTPGAPDAAPTRAYLTLTTCEPKYSASRRLIIHAALAGEPIPWANFPSGPPALHES